MRNVFLVIFLMSGNVEWSALENMKNVMVLANNGIGNVNMIITLMISTERVHKKTNFHIIQQCLEKKIIIILALKCLFL